MRWPGSEGAGQELDDWVTQQALQMAVMHARSARGSRQATLPLGSPSSATRWGRRVCPMNLKGLYGRQISIEWKCFAKKGDTRGGSCGSQC